MAATASALLVVLLLGGSLPDPAPMHFGISGRPDAYTSRAKLLWLMATLVTLVPTLTWWLTDRAARSGKANIPNASHWFADSRKEATRRYLSGHAAFLSVLLALYLSYNAWLLVRACQVSGQAPSLDMPMFIGGLALFVSLTTGSLVVLYLRFSRTGA